MSGFFVGADHYLEGILRHHSPFCNSRPDQEDIQLLVIHHISLPAGVFGGPYIDQLFCGTLDCRAHADFAELQGLEVSAHVLIRRDGQVIQYVPFHLRAWHAGASSWQGRERCNDYSIGIELEGTELSGYTPAQYETLAQVTLALMQRYPGITSERIVGHEHIAPTRKQDPGISFDWLRYQQALR